MSENQAAADAYRQDAVRYVEKIVQLFGAYKRRGIDFMQLRPGLHVLDAGCGAGDDAGLMAGIVGPDGKVTGVDTNPEMIRTAGMRAGAAMSNASFVQADVYALPFADASFDRARADRVFQHLKDPVRALGELVRVTRPGGALFVMDVDWETLVVDGSDHETTRAVLRFEADQQVNPRAGRQLAGLFRRAGLERIEAYAESVCIADFGVARYVCGLDAYARKAAQAGVVSEAAADAWLRDLEEKDRAGQFFACLTGVGVRGFRPD